MISATESHRIGYRNFCIYFNYGNLQVVITTSPCIHAGCRCLYTMHHICVNTLSLTVITWSFYVYILMLHLVMICSILLCHLQSTTGKITGGESGLMSRKTWRLKYELRRKTPPKKEDTKLPLTRQTYRHKFHALLYYEEEEHMQVLRDR